MTDLSVLFPAPPKKHYRSRYEILAIVIEAASHRAVTMTHLMYLSFLSYHQLKVDYLPVCLDNGLILKHADGYFTTTERGLNFLRKWAEIQEMEKGEKKI